MSRKIFIILFAALMSGFSYGLHAQIITTMAGTGTTGYGGDGQFAAYAKIGEPSALAVDRPGNVFICDRVNNRIRKIDVYGVMTTYAGTGVQGMSGDGGQATAAKIFGPCGLRLDGQGTLYIADSKNNRIRKIDKDGIITTVVGNGVAGHRGDDSAALHAELNNPNGIAFDKNGNMYIADASNNCVRKVNATDGIITTIAGKNDTLATFAGDGGPATRALLNFPQAVAVDDSGNVFIADTHNYRIRKISAATGIITTAAGNNIPGYGGDQGQPFHSQINIVTDLVFDHKGNLYIADYSNQRVRKLDPSGVITTVVGTGVAGHNGDNGPAADAQLVTPRSVAVDTADNLYIGEGSCRLRFVYQDDTRTDSLTIYPNPCPINAQLFLFSKYEELANIEVINSSGRIVYTALGPTNRFINLKFDDPGFYMVYAVSKHGKWRGKVINHP